MKVLKIIGGVLGLIVLAALLRPDTRTPEQRQADARRAAIAASVQEEVARQENLRNPCTQPYSDYANVKRLHSQYGDHVATQADHRPSLWQDARLLPPALKSPNKRGKKSPASRGFFCCAPRPNARYIKPG
jgi:hypothetical protein